MPKGILFVRKELDGEAWENSYPFATGSNDFDNLDATALTDIGFNGDLTDNSTNFDAAGYATGVVKFVTAVMAFERNQLPQAVQITAAYVSDGLKNSGALDIGPLASVFASKPVNLPGLRPGGVLELAPGTITLRVQRVPAGYSTKASSVWYRGLLLDSQVKLGGRGLVAFTDGSTGPAIQADLQARLIASRLDSFFNDGFGGVYTGIGHRASVSVLTTDSGDLLGVRKISGMRAIGPASRQVKRGRRRPV